jgi:hypothetical protein
MSIDDIQYLKQNSFKQSYTFIIDSKDRNYLDFREPNNYTITFDEPFKNVFGLEVIDASVPKTMYNIDKYNNILYYKINDSSIEYREFINNTIHSTDNNYFSQITLSTGEYSISTLIKEINYNFFKKYGNNDVIKIKALTTPPDISNKIEFISKFQFCLNMNISTINKSLGFDLTQNDNNTNDFEYISEIHNDINKYKFFFSKNFDTNHKIISPGIVDLIGEKYVILNCPEIEEHSTISLSYSKHNLGLARFKLGIIGYNDENISINKTKLREFHPIGKFSKMTLQFKTQAGFLYDFKGTNHNITFNIHYYQAIDNNEFNKSVLNPNYNPNFLKYKIDYQLKNNNNNFSKYKTQLNYNSNSDSNSESQSNSESDSDSKSDS